MASWRERRQQWADSREEAQNNASEATTEAGGRRPASAWPFVLAAGIVVAILAAIFLSAKFAPAEKNITQAQLMTDSITDFVDAQNTGDAELLRSATCSDQVAKLIRGTDDQYRSDRAEYVQENGKTTVDGVPTDYQVNGDRGVATVPTKEAKSGATADDQWKFVRSGDQWLVCNV